MANYSYDPANYNQDGGGGGGGNLIPNGKHIVRVIDHELSETNSGLGQVVVEFEDRDGRTRKAWLICEGRAGFQFGSLLNACGWTSKIDLEKPGMIKRAVYEKDVEIVVKDDTYNGETKPKVKYINKAPNGFGPTSSRIQGDPRGDDPPPPADDDIPF
jgi:hypothetical protein